jgi:uncharacterized protein (TIGR03086 family)
MDDLTLLDEVLAKAATLIGNVNEDQWGLPTPCPDYDVKALVGHMVGWAQVFASAANGEQFQGDPTAYAADADAAQDFRAAAARMSDGWRSGGVDRTVPMVGGEQPASMVFNMTLMEYMTHGWDLARGTAQPVPFTDEEAAETLARAEQTLPPKYRGEGMPFGDIVDTPADAPSIARLAAFMGRDPAPVS